MPSTLVHLAIGALLAAALLESHFDARSLLFVLFAVFLPDIDTFLGIWLLGWHRAALHTLVLPVILGAFVIYDLRRADSWLRGRGPRAVRIAWVSVFALLVAGIGPDLFFNGVNLFWPLHDQFYALNGKVELSTRHGIVQTLWEQQTSIRGTTETTHYRTGVDVKRGPDPENVERTFLVAGSGLRALLVLTAIVVTGIRLRTADRNV